MGSWEAVGKVGLEAETQIKFGVPTLQEIYIHLFIRSFSHSTATNHCLTVPGTVLGAFINFLHSHRKQVQSLIRHIPAREGNIVQTPLLTQAGLFLLHHAINLLGPPEAPVFPVTPSPVEPQRQR